MKRILKVTGIIVVTVVTLAYIALTVLNAVVLRNCVDSIDEYNF